MVNALNMPFKFMGEFTIFDEPVLTVRESKIPAELAVTNSAITKKMARYI